MKVTELLAVLTGFTAAVLLVTDASAMYNARIGRFMQRDVLQFADGMSLYQYAGSRPIVLTDPAGAAGCTTTGPSATDKFLDCHCFCVTDMTLEGKVLDPENEKPGGPKITHVGAELKVTIKGQWAEVVNGGGVPGMEWWEHFSFRPDSYPDNAKTGVWNPAHEMVRRSPTFDAIYRPAFNVTSPPTEFVLWDYPGIELGGVGSQRHAQDLWIAVRAATSQGCRRPCQDAKINTQVKTRYTHLQYRWDGRSSEAEPNLEMPATIPNPPGDPPFGIQ